MKERRAKDTLFAAALEEETHSALEDHLQSELYLARRARTDEGIVGCRDRLANFTEFKVWCAARGGYSDSRADSHVARVSEVRMIQDIEEIRAKLHLDFPCYREILHS